MTARFLFSCSSIQFFNIISDIDIFKTLGQTDLSMSNTQRKITQMAKSPKSGDVQLPQTRILGLPKGSKGSNPVSFFKTWLPQLQISVKGGAVKLDRCHWALTRHPPLGQRPHSVIIKVHNFQDHASSKETAGSINCCKEAARFPLGKTAA